MLNALLQKEMVTIQQVDMIANATVVINSQYVYVSKQSHCTP